MARQPVERITFGIRFAPQYRIGDKLGAIVDAILGEKGTPYGPEVFPFLESAHHRRTLKGESHRLVITERDLILTQGVTTRQVDEVADLSKQFVEWALKPMLEHAHVRHVNRYGLLFELAECSAALRVPLTQHYVSSEAPDARDLTMRFSRRLQTDEAHWRKDVNDYRNVIYTLQQTDGGEAHINLDFQHYFDPVLADADDLQTKPFGSFVAGGIAYFTGPFATWLVGLVRADEEAA